MKPTPEIIEEWMTNSQNGIFRNSDGKSIAYARVEKVETGWKFHMMKLTKPYTVDDLKKSVLHLYRRDTNEEVAVLDMAEGQIYESISGGLITAKRPI